MPPASGSGQAAATIGMFPQRGPKPLVSLHFHYLEPKPFFTGRPFAMTHAPAQAKVAGRRAVACAAHAPRRERMSKKRENQKAEISQCPDAEWKICYQCGSEYDFYGPQIKCDARGAKSLDGMKTSIYLRRRLRQPLGDRQRQYEAAMKAVTVAS